MPLLGVEPESSVLDVGCGTGSLVLALAELYPRARLTGVDFSEGMIEVARGKAPPGLDAAFQAAAAEALPFGDASYDLVLSTLSYHHWSDRRLGVAECVRVLRPGGRLVIVDVTGDRWYRRIYRLCGRFRNLVGHVSYPRAAEIMDIFQDAGLKDVRQAGIWPAITMISGRK